MRKLRDRNVTCHAVISQDGISCLLNSGEASNKTQCGSWTSTAWELQKYNTPGPISTS